MPADVRTDSAPGKFYHGHVGFISPTAEFTPKTVETRELRTDLVYRLRVVVDNPDGGLRQGMPVTVRFDDERRRGRGHAVEPLVGSRGGHQAFGATRTPALDRLNARIEPGQVTGLVGPDGAGKTTLMRLLAGLLLPTRDGSPSAAPTPAASSPGSARSVELHAAAVRAVRGPDGQENLNLYADLRGVTGAERDGPSSGCWPSPTWPVHRPAGRQALRRHEAEARAGLRPDPHAAAAAARRAERRRRSDLAPRAVADGLRPGRPGHRRRLEHGLSRRGRALRRGVLLNEGKIALRRPAQGTDRRVDGPQLPGRGRGAAAGARSWPRPSSGPRWSTA